jgi:SAM-dependent methyltransferase
MGGAADAGGSEVDGYRPSTYGDRFADVYDDWYHDVSDVDATVERVAALAGPRGGRVLELGAGSGRLAVPLAGAGLDVWAVDASAAMLERLRAKPGGEAVHTVVDDMAELAAPELAAPGPDGGAGFAVALCAFNTLFNLTDTPAQARCLGRVAELLAPGGRLLVEAFVPPPSGEGEADDAGGDRMAGGRGGGEGDAGSGAVGRAGAGFGGVTGAVEPRHIGLDEVVLTVSRVDPAARIVVGQHVQITEAGIRLRPWVLHYASPEGVDELAAVAGLRLVERHAGWRGEPFSSASAMHVSCYAPIG